MTTRRTGRERPKTSGGRTASAPLGKARTSSSRATAPRRQAHAARGPVDVLLGAPATADLLHAELARALGRVPVTEHAPGVVAVPADLDTRGLVFARQLVPHARVVEGASASELADHLVRALGEDDERAWLSGALALHVVTPDPAERGARLVDDHPLASARQHLVELLEVKRRGRANKQGVAPAPVCERFMDAVVVDAWRVLLAGRASPIGDPLTAWPVPFAGGRAPVVVDHQAPSSAHRKLDEALSWLGVAPARGDVVLDLGAAPGGWTHVALRGDARVIAVDRGAMDARVMDTGRVTHVRRDAFAAVLEEERGATPLIDDVDWLVCDIIVEPERTLALVERALASPRLSAFVVTLKLRRPVDLDVVWRARALLDDEARFVGRAKCLFHNKLELTLLGRRRA